MPSADKQPTAGVVRHSSEIQGRKTHAYQRLQMGVSQHLGHPAVDQTTSVEITLDRRLVRLYERSHLK